MGSAGCAERASLLRPFEHGCTPAGWLVPRSTHSTKNRERDELLEGERKAALGNSFFLRSNLAPAPADMDMYGNEITNVVGKMSLLA